MLNSTPVRYISELPIGFLWKMENTPFSRAQTGKPLASITWSNQGHNPITFQFCQLLLQWHMPHLSLVGTAVPDLPSSCSLPTHFGDPAWGPRVHHWGTICPHRHHGQFGNLLPPGRAQTRGVISWFLPFPHPAQVFIRESRRFLSWSATRRAPKVWESGTYLVPLVQLNACPQQMHVDHHSNKGIPLVIHSGPLFCWVLLRSNWLCIFPFFLWLLISAKSQVNHLLWLNDILSSSFTVPSQFWPLLRTL